MSKVSPLRSEQSENTAKCCQNFHLNSEELLPTVSHKVSRTKMTKSPVNPVGGEERDGFSASINDVRRHCLSHKRIIKGIRKRRRTMQMMGLLLLMMVTLYGANAISIEELNEDDDYEKISIINEEACKTAGMVSLVWTKLFELKDLVANLQTIILTVKITDELLSLLDNPMAIQLQGNEWQRARKLIGWGTELYEILREVMKDKKVIVGALGKEASVEHLKKKIEEPKKTAVQTESLVQDLEEGTAMEKISCKPFPAGFQANSSPKGNLKQAAKREPTANLVSPGGQTWDEIISGVPQGVKKTPNKTMERDAALWSYLTDKEKASVGSEVKVDMKLIYQKTVLAEEGQDQGRKQQAEVDRILSTFGQTSNQPEQSEEGTTETKKTRNDIRVTDTYTPYVFQMMEKMQEDMRLMAMVKDLQLRSRKKTQDILRKDKGNATEETAQSETCQKLKFLIKAVVDVLVEGSLTMFGNPIKSSRDSTDWARPFLQEQASFPSQVLGRVFLLLFLHAVLYAYMKVALICKKIKEMTKIILELPLEVVTQQAVTESVGFLLQFKKEVKDKGELEKEIKRLKDGIGILFDELQKCRQKILNICKKKEQSLHKSQERNMDVYKRGRDDFRQFLEGSERANRGASSSDQGRNLASKCDFDGPYGHLADACRRNLPRERKLKRKRLLGLLEEIPAVDNVRKITIYYQTAQRTSHHHEGVVWGAKGLSRINEV